jgi:transcriptional regulator GlxA family with amidase domain
LDVFGPLEVFGVLPDQFSIRLVGPSAGAVRSAQGPRAMAELGYEEVAGCEVVLVPGGIGTRRLVEDRSFLECLARLAAGAEFVTSVCTGSGVLAAAGLLDGYRATSNKRAFTWACQQSADVTWVPEARWVEDRSRWTSSGVAAGIDMALGLISHLHGPQLAADVADRFEYESHCDPSWDPFATKNGLVADRPGTP